MRKGNDNRFLVSFGVWNGCLKVNLAAMQDDYLFRQIKRGDKEAFDHLFNRYYRGMVMYALHYTESVEMGEDIVQEVFLRLWRDRKKITIHTSIRSYLSAAVKNKCLDDIKHSIIRNNYENEILKRENNPGISGPNLSFELVEKLEQTINALPEQVRKIFVMNRYENKKYREIAEILDISVKTVEASIGKALRVLREELKEWL
jgi:RNA polymerase sigma-70 factor (ECF subfamily)